MNIERISRQIRQAEIDAEPVIVQPAVVAPVAAPDCAIFTVKSIQDNHLTCRRVVDPNGTEEPVDTIVAKQWNLRIGDMLLGYMNDGITYSNGAGQFITAQQGTVTEEWQVHPKWNAASGNFKGSVIVAVRANVIINNSTGFQRVPWVEVGPRAWALKP